MAFSFGENNNVGTNKDWQIIQPANNDHEAKANSIGPIIGRDIQGTALHYVTGLDRDEDGKLWVSSYYAQLAQLTENLDIDYQPNIAYQAPANGDGVAYLQDMSITKDGSRLILAVSYAHHCVKVYNQDTGALVSVIGVPNSSGNLDVNKLYNPHSAVRLANGNIAVTSYNGFGTAATNHGTISEWDISTPTATLVASRLQFTNGGVSAVGTNIIYRPMRMILDNNDANIIWVSEYGRGKILKINTTTWLIEDIILNPATISTIGSSYGLTQTQAGDIVVASNAAKQIVGINTTTKDLSFVIDVSQYGSGRAQMRGLIEITPGQLAWADWETQKIYRACIDKVQVPYQQPTIENGWQLDAINIPANLNTTTWNMEVNDHEINTQVKELIILKSKI